MIEFKEWDSSQTEKKYFPGTKIAYVPLGEGAYGLILVTPAQNIFLEEVPIYGGDPKYWGNWGGTVEQAVSFIKKHFV